MPVTRILIKKDGTVVIEGEGYVGKACVSDLERIIEGLKSLGVSVEVKNQQKKPEYYMSSSEVITYEQ